MSGHNNTTLNTRCIEAFMTREAPAHSCGPAQRVVVGGVDYSREFLLLYCERILLEDRVRIQQERSIVAEKDDNKKEGQCLVFTVRTKLIRRADATKIQNNG